MKNLLIANLSSSNRYKGDRIKTLINAQIENSLELGWNASDIILISNFDYNFMGVKSTKTNLNKKCLTGSKMFGLKFLLDLNLVNDVIWAHDLDAWQNVPFLCPDFKEVGISCYSTGKYNGGSIFWRTSAIDIVNEIINRINKKEENKEEPTLNKVLKSKEYENRVTALNHTYNVGCSAYVVRWTRSIKPLRVCHFHPYNNTAWETHCLDRNGLDEKGITDRLEKLIRKYYPNIATELSEKGKKAQIERRQKRLSEV
jgi:hypothetical protein